LRVPHKIIGNTGNTHGASIVNIQAIKDRAKINMLNIRDKTIQLYYGWV
jgi:hypothetical protein